MTSRVNIQRWCVLGMVVAATAIAQAGAAQAPDSAEVVVRAGTVFDGMGAVRRHMDVVVQGGRITAVRPSNQSAWAVTSSTVRG